MEHRPGRLAANFLDMNRSGIRADSKRCGRQVPAQRCKRLRRGAYNAPSGMGGKLIRERETIAR